MLDLSAVKLRLETKTYPDPNTGCLLWGGCVDKQGYGIIFLRTQLPNNVKAHRASYEIANGPIPKGLFVCHTCDTPACVNPKHLFLGTCADNMQDCSKKKRTARQKRTHCRRCGSKLGHIHNTRRCLSCYRNDGNASKRRRYHGESRAVQTDQEES